MSDFVLTVVPKPDETKTITLVFQVSPGIKGTGAENYFCGFCGDKLMESMSPRQKLRGLFIRCSECGSYNSTDCASPRRP